jgi:probable F420-dependent oxidoreductase
MKFSMSVALCPPDQLVELAVAAEENGFSAIVLPDSLFYSEEVSADYPYTPDGSRFWNADTPWIDPLIAAGAMATATETIRFYTSVLKLGSRHPVVLARQLVSVAAMTGDRFGFGVGVGWSPEEFRWCGVPYERRGKRADESIEVIQRILAGGMVEYHGEFFDFGKLQMSPTPRRRMPVYIGGHTGPALRRAVRYGDGWASAMMTLDQLRETIATLKTMLAEAGRADDPFEYQAVCVDRFGVSGYREQAEVGVTDAIVMPWVFDGLSFDADMSAKKDSIKKFADQIISAF